MCGAACGVWKEEAAAVAAAVAVAVAAAAGGRGCEDGRAKVAGVEVLGKRGVRRRRRDMCSGGVCACRVWKEEAAVAAAAVAAAAGGRG